MTDSVQYDPTAALRCLPDGRIARMEPELLAARDEVLADVDLMASGTIPTEKQPLDAGFIEWPRKLLDEFNAERTGSLIGRIQSAARVLREETDSLIVLGIGGSYLGARAMFEALCDPCHNERTRPGRRSVPRVYFDGNNVDSVRTQSLLSLLGERCDDAAVVDKRWAIVVISKSGGTLETAVAFRVFRQALDEYYGADSDLARRFVIPVTGPPGSRLRALARSRRYERLFSVPDTIGGRFSVLTPVGLLPAAAMGLNPESLLQGAADMTDRFRTQPPGENPVLDYVATCHAFEADQQRTIRVLSTWGARLEAMGMWYDQLLSESLGKHGLGATPVTVVNTRDLHSRGQQHQDGRQDKLITNLFVSSPVSDPMVIERLPDNQDNLNQYAGTTIPELLFAAFQGTNKACAEADPPRPTADILVPGLTEYTLGQLFQMFMLATSLEGRLIGVNPYGQPGVEAYKRNMTALLRRT